MNILKPKSKGFTLIELLIVIAIIGVLAGILLVVLDPAAQRRRAQETTLKANVGKLCLAYQSCLNSTIDGDTAKCDAHAEMGVDTPTTPTGASYPDPSAPPQGTLGTCIISCGTNNVLSGTNCIIDF